jgi:hypothetical protein
MNKWVTVRKDGLYAVLGEPLKAKPDLANKIFRAARVLGLR